MKKKSEIPKENINMNISYLLRLVIVLLTFLSLSNCNTKKKAIEGRPAPLNRIEFGYIDKSTKAAVVFILDESGYLYQKDALSNTNMIEQKIKPEEANYIRKIANRLYSSHSNLYEIGEETHFLRIRKGVEIVEWKWIKNGPDELPDDIKELEVIFINIFEKNK